jgi:hypothetical protein
MSDESSKMEKCKCVFALKVPVVEKYAYILNLILENMIKKQV